MFYSQDILQKRGGRFGIVWIAATGMKSLNKREYYSVNVRVTCEDIIDYIFLRAPPKRPGGPRPRLSLYLASQLMYGVIKVHQKQTNYLLGDVSAVSGKCSLVTAPVFDIDLKGPTSSTAVTNPDYAALNERTGPEFDPTFGELMREISVTFDIIPEMEMWKLHSSPELLPSPGRQPDIPLPSTPPATHQPFKADTGSPHTVSSSEITLTEEPTAGPQSIQVPADEELPMLDGRELEMLSQDLGLDMPLLDVMLSPTHAVSTPIQSTAMGEDGTLRDVLPPIEETPIAESLAESLVAQPTRIRRVRPPSPGVTPKIPSPVLPPPKRKRASLVLELSPNITPSPQRRRRKRQLLFTDTETQIGKHVIRENMKKGKDLCMPFVLPPVGPTRLTDLLTRPHRKELLHPRLAHLWKRNLYATKYEEADSDREHPIWTVPDLAVERSSASEEEQHPELPRPDSPVVQVQAEDLMGLSIEHHRNDAVSFERRRSMKVVTPLAITIERELQDSRDRSQDRSRGSSREELSVPKRRKVSVGTSSEDDIGPADIQVPPLDFDMTDVSRTHVTGFGDQLYVVPEVLEEELFVATSPKAATEKLSDVEEDLISRVNIQTTVEKWTTFKSICPLHTSRPRATRAFTHLLGLCAMGKLQARQKEPYADIYLARGSNW